MTLPWTELLCGFLLLANVWTETALICASGLIFIFLIATGQAWVRGLEISCCCFDLKMLGVHSIHSGLVKFLESAGFAFFRNLALGGLSVYLLRDKVSGLLPLLTLREPKEPSSKRAEPSGVLAQPLAPPRKTRAISK